MFVFVCVLRLYPANPGRGLWYVCLGSGFGFHPADPGRAAGVYGFVCGLASASICVTDPPQAFGASVQCYQHPGCGILCTIASIFGELRLAMNALPVVRPLWCNAFGGGLPCLKGNGSVCALCMYPANPGWAVHCGCVCWDSGQLRPAIPSSGVAVCVFVCALRIWPPSLGWGSWCVCLGSGFGFHPANPGSGAGMYVFLCTLHLIYQIH